MISSLCNQIFEQSITDYHINDDIDFDYKNPYQERTIEHLLYKKNWIDDAQWHMEDVVRNPSIDCAEGLMWKRRIDASNQERTDLVEFIDSYFLDRFKNITPKDGAKVNTESPAWAVDRLSILALKIFHMKEEAERTNASEEHRINCTNKLNVLLQQRIDLSQSIDDLIVDIENGDKYMKVYKQLKMYNDPSLNPILYNLKKGNNG